MQPENNNDHNTIPNMTAGMQPQLLQFAKNAALPFPYPAFNINTQFTPGPVAHMIPTTNTAPGNAFQAATQFSAVQPQQLRQMQTNAFTAANISQISASSPLPSPSTPTSVTQKSMSGGSASSSTPKTSRQQQKQQEEQDNSFKSIYGKYQKKRSRNQLYNNNGTADIGVSDMDEKFDFLTQIICLQATKIRRLENRLRAVEEILPDYGSFTEQEKLRLTPQQSVGGTSAADATDSSKKEKRPKTDYQIFMSEEIPRIRSQNPDIPQKEAFSIAAKNWSLKKESLEQQQQTKAIPDQQYQQQQQQQQQQQPPIVSFQQPTLQQYQQ
jgi:hypothetical protein